MRSVLPQRHHHRLQIIIGHISFVRYVLRLLCDSPAFSGLLSGVSPYRVPAAHGVAHSSCSPVACRGLPSAIVRSYRGFTGPLMFAARGILCPPAAAVRPILRSV